MGGKPAIVLVHGAWGSPEMWDHVIDALPSGLEVLVADLPTCNRAGTTLADDAAHVVELVGDRDAVLVGHSYGGVVITEAAGALPGARHLVYLAACMPDVGESMLDWTMKRPSAVPAPLEFFEDGTSIIAVDEAAFPYDEVTMARLREVRLRPFAIAGLTTPVTSAAWSSVPSTYLVAGRDTMIDPDTQREMALRAGSMAEVDAEHQVILSDPRIVADLIATLVG